MTPFKEQNDTEWGRLRSEGFASPALAYRDNDGKVPVEWLWHEGLGEPADVGIRPKVVGWKALIAGSEGDRGGEGDAD